MTETSSTWYNPAWSYRRKMVVNGRHVAGDLINFPVLVSLADPALRPVAQGGHMRQAGGEDIIFILPDEQVELDYELERYIAQTGELRAWVNVPRLPAQADTVIYLYYGGPALAGRVSAATWMADHTLVLHLTAAGETCPDSTGRHNPSRVGYADTGSLYMQVDLGNGPLARQAITVEAWVDTRSERPETLQALVSQWALRPAFNAFAAYDAGQTDGLRTVGYFGAVFDGRFVYFSPAYDGSDNHGRVLRYDTHGDFTDPAGWSAYDAGQTSGLNSKGYYGGVFDGRYVYFVPRLDKNFTDQVAHHSRVLRYDTHGDFKDPVSWQAHDAGNRVSSQGAAFDGRHIYFCPGYEHASGEPVPGAPAYQWSGVVPSGKVLRYDTHGDFSDPASYTTYDASGTAGLDTRCYDGAVFDGRYIYFVPLESKGVVLRYDTQTEFTRPDSWAAYDAGRTGGLKMGWSVGAIFDGRYVYIVPYSNGVVVRYDTRVEFGDSAGWLAYDAGHTCGLITTCYDGAVFDGKYIYFIPFHQGSDSASGFHARFLRYDTTREFTDRAAWNAADAASTAGLNPVGFNGGAFDGRFIYCAPWRDGLQPNGLPAAHGRVLRYDTTGNGAAFSLRLSDYGHNGGLCGVRPGPSFLVNTDRGVLSVQTHTGLPAGRHHLVGVYDGATLTLVIDGAVVAERSGGGRIAASDSPIVVGRIQDGLGYIDGRVGEVRIASVARSLAWLKTEYSNVSCPADFLHAGGEERYDDC